MHLVAGYWCIATNATHTHRLKLSYSFVHVNKINVEIWIIYWYIEHTYLRSNNDESMGRYVVKDLRIAFVAERSAMKEQDDIKSSFFGWRDDNQWLRRRWWGWRWCLQRDAFCGINSSCKYRKCGRSQKRSALHWSCRLGVHPCCHYRDFIFRARTYCWETIERDEQQRRISDLYIMLRLNVKL